VDLGFETIGNATVICYDRQPILVTDPWIRGPAYFGSWTCSHEIPEQQMQMILSSEYVWLSHGHPDHLSTDSLELLKDKKILLPDHFGERIKSDLETAGFDVQVLQDRVWRQLSKNIRIMCIANYNQDAVLLIDLDGTLIVNKNDAIDTGWGTYVRKLVRGYKCSFLLALSGYGDADMINFFDEDGTRILPPAAEKVPPGATIAQMTEFFGTKFFVPFSSMHKYQRRDSIWANQCTTGLDDYAKGFNSRTAEILPAYIQYDCRRQTVLEISPRPVQERIFEPEDFGDDWSVPLEGEEASKIREYFLSVKHLEHCFDYINFRVGGRDNLIELGGRKMEKGITFEAPRQSLVTAIEWKIFDDLLIGNFMKTTLHGFSGRGSLYPDFSPYVAKYADNGQARTPEELRIYFEAYKQRAPFEYMRNQVVRHSVKLLDMPIMLIRSTLPQESFLYKSAKRSYIGLRKMLGYSRS
jgi:hypothetical protein